MRFFILFLSLFLCLPFYAFTQVSKGNKLAGGSFSWSNSHEDDKEYKETRLNIAPSMSYMINNKMGIGLSVAYFYRKTATNRTFVNPSTGTVTLAYASNITNSVSIEPFVIFYWPIKDKIGLNLRSYLSLKKSRAKQDTPTISETRESISAAIGALPAMYYNINKKLLLSASFGHCQFQKIENLDDHSQRTFFNLNFRATPTLGLTYVWP